MPRKMKIESEKGTDKPISELLLLIVANVLGQMVEVYYSLKLSCSRLRLEFKSRSDVLPLLSCILVEIKAGYKYIIPYWDFLLYRSSF